MDQGFAARPTRRISVLPPILLPPPARFPWQQPHLLQQLGLKRCVLLVEPPQQLQVAIRYQASCLVNIPAAGRLTEEQALLRSRPGPVEGQGRLGALTRVCLASGPPNYRPGSQARRCRAWRPTAHSQRGLRRYPSSGKAGRPIWASTGVERPRFAAGRADLPLSWATGKAAAAAEAWPRAWPVHEELAQRLAHVGCVRAWEHATGLPDAQLLLGQDLGSGTLTAPPKPPVRSAGARSGASLDLLACCIGKIAARTGRGSRSKRNEHKATTGRATQGKLVYMSKHGRGGPGGSEGKGMPWLG